MKYQTKPVIVEARQLRKDNANEIRDWILDNGGKATSYHPEERSWGFILHIKIFTQAGSIIVELGDWVVQTGWAKFDCYKSEVFAKTFEEVPEPMEGIFPVPFGDIHEPTEGVNNE